MSKQQNSATLSDTSWFPHDLDASNDPKLGALLDDHGAAGYGIFWHLVELMHAEPDGALPLKNYLYKAVAGRMKSDAKTVELLILQAIQDYELFVELEGKFTADRTQTNLKRRAQNKEKAKESGAKGGKASADRRATLKGPSSNPQGPVEPSSSKSNQRRGEEISIDISPLIQILKDSRAGTPTIESLCEAFLSSYPRAVLEESRERIRKIWKEKIVELEKGLKIVELVELDLESTKGKATFFDDAVKYLTDSIE
jgi:hypothetical protein